MTTLSSGEGKTLIQAGIGLTMLAGISVYVRSKRQQSREAKSKRFLQPGPNEMVVSFGVQ